MIALQVALLLCNAEPMHGWSWSSWYMIDGRQCWYEGKPRTVPRESLAWPVVEPQAPDSPTAHWKLEDRWWTETGE